MTNAPVIFDCIRDTDRPARPLPGFQHFTIQGLASIWGDTNPREMPPHDNLKQIADRDGVVCLDIEWFALESMYHKDISDAQKQTNRRHLRNVCDAIHAINPALTLGLYGEMPCPYGNGFGLDWNDATADACSVEFKRSRNPATGKFEPRGLADAVDVIFPSAYVPNAQHTYQHWRDKMTATVKIARTYQKRVYPFLWNRYSQTRDLIEKDRWESMVRHILTIADGCVLWSPYEHHDWHDNHGWWLAARRIGQDIKAGS